MKRLLFISVILFLLTSKILFAQGALDLVNYSGSASTFGMGEEGAALQNGQDAFTFNPANLSFSDNLRVSFFRNPFNYGSSMPISNFTTSVKIKGIGSFGFQYLRHYWGEFNVATEYDPIGLEKKESFYQYSLAAGYSAEVSRELSLGLSLKFGQEKFGQAGGNSLMLSLGLNYHPDVFNRKFGIGFSLMNLGGPLVREYSYTHPGGITENQTVKDPISSKLHLALSMSPIETEYLSIGTQLGASRYLIGLRDNPDEAKSSFSSLFQGWKDFPADTKIHAGLSFEWKPLDLGNDFWFNQNFYLGSVSSGNKTYTGSYFTNGAEIKIGYKEVNFSLGYSGQWHKIQSSEYIIFELPSETFQFSLEWNLNKHFNWQTESKGPSGLNHIEITAGTGYSFRSGHTLPDVPAEFSSQARVDMKNSLSFLIEAAFYIDQRNALVTSFTYSSIPVSLYFSQFNSSWLELFKTTYETVGFYSAYRYHPIESLSSFYIQGGPGIVRLNPVVLTNPKYFYQASFNGWIGASLDVLPNSLVLNPELGYQLLMLPLYSKSSTPRLGGNNQFTVSVKFGYKF